MLKSVSYAKEFTYPSYAIGINMLFLILLASTLRDNLSWCDSHVTLWFSHEYNCTFSEFKYSITQNSVNCMFSQK